MSKRNVHKTSQQQNNLKKAFNDVNNLKKTKSASYYSKNATGLAFKEKEPEQQLINNKSDMQNQTEALGYKFEAIESRFNEYITRSISQIKDEIRKELSDHKISNIKWLIATVIAIVAILITFHFASLSNLNKIFNDKIQILENSISDIIKHLE